MCSGRLKACGQHRKLPSGDQPGRRNSVFSVALWKGASTRRTNVQSLVDQRSTERSSPCEAMYRPIGSHATPLAHARWPRSTATSG